MRIPKLFAARPPPSERIPIAILSYDRPGYLRRVLRSLRRQVDPGDEIALFQDGAFNAYSNRWKADPHKIEQCAALFRAMFPWGSVHVSPTNLGIAGNYRRAEEFVFVEREHPCGLFLEDDLVLSRHYLAAIRMLLGFARKDPRIAYVSAYGDLWASRLAQWRTRRRVMHMHENWSFAMTREAWLAEQPFRARYLKLIENVDYSQRDNEAIRAFYRERGWDMPITSQDGARWVASLELGKVRVTTTDCYARYIGRQGEHATPQYYKKAGFARTRMALWSPEGLLAPTDAQIAEWLAVETKRFRGPFEPFY